MATKVGLKKSFCAPYAEAMCQIWWRSVHKSRHNIGDRRRTPETRHAEWFYVLSNAAIHCIGQTM